MKKIYVDVKEMLGSSEFSFAGKEKTFKYENNKRTDVVIGTTIIILDKELNKIKVKIPKIIEEKFEMLENIEFENLKGTVWGVSKTGSSFVELFVSYSADDVKKIEKYGII
ncbi:TPA: hypothetical protein ACGO64_001949 [Streptococcus suis]